MAEEEGAPAREQRDAIIQRVRVGLTGLAAVFLLTLLAASIFNLLGQDDQHGARLANGAVASNMAASDEQPKEPLAELGVAPGGNMPKAATPAQPGKAIPTLSPPAPILPAQQQAPAAGVPTAATTHHEAPPAPRG
jgi:hypothetical protein